MAILHENRFRAVKMYLLKREKFLSFADMALN
jgi:hypothetical protein